MKRVYYCYSCGEYFKVSSKKVNIDSQPCCPHCSGDDTEHSPEEEPAIADDEIYIEDDNVEDGPADVEDNVVSLMSVDIDADTEMI